MQAPLNYKNDNGGSASFLPPIKQSGSMIMDNAYKRGQLSINTQPYMSKYRSEILTQTPKANYYGQEM